MTFKQKIYRIIGVLFFGCLGIFFLTLLAGAISVLKQYIDPDNSQMRLVGNISIAVSFVTAYGSFYLMRKFWKQLRNPE